MSVLINNNGTLDPVAGNGIKNTFTGTTAEVEAAMQAGLIPDGTVIYITDDNGVGESAEDVAYDNTTSGLSADNVQDAVDEVVSEKQDKTDNTLTTTNKTIPGAINEINTALSQFGFTDVNKVMFRTDNNVFRLNYYVSGGYYTMSITTNASPNTLKLDFYNNSTQSWTNIFQCNSVI